MNEDKLAKIKRQVLGHVEQDDAATAAEQAKFQQELESLKAQFAQIEARLAAAARLAGDQAAGAEHKPKMVTWRRCVRPWMGTWFPSGKIPEGFVPMVSQTLPVETVKQLPEGATP